MAFIPKSGLHRQLLFYIAFLTIVFLTMTLEMTLFLKGNRVQGALLAQITDPNLATETVNLILLKVGVLLFNLLISIGLIMLLFSKRLIIPLEQIIKGTRAISNGDFSATLPEQTRDELGELATRINELAANYQELILLSKNLVEQTRLTQEENNPENRKDETLKLLNELDETLKEFGRSFYKC